MLEFIKPGTPTQNSDTGKAAADDQEGAISTKGGAKTGSDNTCSGICYHPHMDT
jgi:hypothetical protein